MKKAPKERNSKSLEGIVHHLFRYRAHFTQPFLYSMWAAQTQLLSFAPSPLPISSGTLTQSRRHCTCGGSGCGSHADHLAGLVNNDIRIVEH